MDFMEKLICVCEAADDSLIADCYMESGINVEAIGNKISETIKKILENLKKFAEKVKRSAETTAIKTMLRSNYAKSKLFIDWYCDDKIIAKAINLINKEEMSMVSDIRKIHDKCMSHKIDAYKAMDLCEQRYDRYFEKIGEIEDRISDYAKGGTNANRRNKSVQVDTAFNILVRMFTLQEKASDASYSAIEREIKRLEEEARALEEANKLTNKMKEAAKKAGSAVANTVKKAASKLPEAGASLKSKIAALLSRAHRKTVQEVHGVAKLKQRLTELLNKVKGKDTNNKKKKGKAYQEETTAMDFVSDYFVESEDLSQDPPLPDQQNESGNDPDGYESEGCKSEGCKSEGCATEGCGEARTADSILNGIACQFAAGSEEPEYPDDDEELAPPDENLNDMVKQLYTECTGDVLDGTECYVEDGGSLFDDGSELFEESQSLEDLISKI